MEEAGLEDAHALYGVAPVVGLLDKVAEARRVLPPYVRHRPTALLRRRVRLPRRVVQARSHLFEFPAALARESLVFPDDHTNRAQQHRRHHHQQAARHHRSS